MDITADDEIFVGEDTRLEFRIYEQDDVTPRDIFGWSLSFIVKRRVTDAEPIIEKLTPTDVEITDAEDGICEVVLSAEDTELLTGGVLYCYELKYMDEGLKAVLVYGDLVPNPSAHGG